jgi:2-succinyl-5-enolpyruvyl-6-hydroxy-3-cyclohexene-1-carboxylate synthase
MYGATFRRIADWAAFRAAVNAGLQADGVSIVEVASDRDSNVTMHRAVWQAVSAALADLTTTPDAA